MKQEFLDRMKQYLGNEYDSYVASLEQPLFRGLRVNTSKIAIDDLLAMNLCELRPSSICSSSFYIEEDVKGLGNHPAHLAGLFYMQEPSASSAVEILDVQEGDWVLDLCAAPGGKSTQIAAKLNNTGFLLSNEIDPKRAQILLSNMERLGFSENMITNARPDILCKEVKGWFDKVLVDAPCSGEGMFKKHDQAMEDWSEEHVLACSHRQLHILDSAYETLKQDGILVYSTCTYAMEENEHVVAQFLENHPDMQLIDCASTFGRSGFPYGSIDETKVRRIFPMDGGEGHFVAKFKKTKEADYTKKQECTVKKPEDYVMNFLKSQLKEVPAYLYVNQDKVYCKNTPFLKLGKVKILRQGVFVGECIKKRIEPHQHFYVASALEHVQSYTLEEEQCHQFLTGNQLFVPGYKGFTQICWKGYPIGFAKGDGQVLKNKYPKGLRLRG